MSAFGYCDLFYTDNRPTVHVRAMVAVLSSEEGGYRIANHGRWRPNHNFGLPDGRSFYIGQVTFDASELNPGEKREVLVEFLDGPGLREHLKPGVTWRIQSGPNLFATAKMLELVSGT